MFGRSDAWPQPLLLLLLLLLWRRRRRRRRRQPWTSPLHSETTAQQPLTPAPPLRQFLTLSMWTAFGKLVGNKSFYSWDQAALQAEETSKAQSKRAADPYLRCLP